MLLNIFVKMAQTFQTLPFLQPSSATQSAPLIRVSQLVVMAISVVLGIAPVRKFRPGPRGGCKFNASVRMRARAEPRGHEKGIQLARMDVCHRPLTVLGLRHHRAMLVAAVGQRARLLTADLEGDAGDEAQR